MKFKVGDKVTINDAGLDFAIESLYSLIRDRLDNESLSSLIKEALPGEIVDVSLDAPVESGGEAYFVKLQIYMEVPFDTLIFEDEMELA
jgi:hypothetical protein